MYVFAALLVQSLVEQKVEFDVCSWFPKGLDCAKDLVVDTDVLFGTLRQKDRRSYVSCDYFGK